MSDRWSRQRSYLRSLQQRDRYRSLLARRVEGKYLLEPGGQRLLHFGSNYYLGALAGRHEGDHNEDDQVLSGAGSSPLVAGHSPEHQWLARAIAELENAERAIVFATGYAACSGVASTLATADDLILSDELNHASLIDGCRLSRARREVFPHRAVEFVKRYLAAHRDSYEQVWLFTESVFSMDGHVAPLEELLDVCERHDVNLVVDEAHATGVLGASGGGLCTHLGIEDRIALRIGTLSKAVGHQGGFAAGPGVLMDYLVNRCRPLIFSTALAPRVAASAARMIASLPSRGAERQRVAALAKLCRQKLSIASEGIEREIPIIPFLVGQDGDAVRLQNALRADGIYVPAIRPPTVAEGTARLRISLTAIHDDDDVQRLVHAIHRHWPARAA
ncbi:MAG: 8-amino-7-oxononanoate synthase [Planctomycetota bacterium]